MDITTAAVRNSRNPDVQRQPLKLYMGTGVEGIRPDGYTTVDIEAEAKPDIVADASSLPMINSGICEELYASHLLEHFAWPNVLKVLKEWSRVLKIGGKLRLSVPDMGLLCDMITTNNNSWHAMSNIYGGHWLTPGGPHGHYYGYTWPMLVELLTVLGYKHFEHWNTFLPEAANGWIFLQNGERVGLSVNIIATKVSEPIVDIDALHDHIRNHNLLQPLMKSVRDLLGREPTNVSDQSSMPHLVQHLHYLLLEERNKCRQLQTALVQERTKKSSPPALTVIEQRIDLAEMQQVVTDIRARNINIEKKLNISLGLEEAPFQGHRDQGIGHLSYSQHGEDFIFAQLLYRMGISRPSYLDIGAHHPTEISNTALLYKRGARGVNIEANPVLIKEFEQQRPDDININVGVGVTRGSMPFYMIDDRSGRNTFDKKEMDEFIGRNPQFSIQKTIDIEVITIDDAVDRYCGGTWPDLVSIDIEGLDFDVLKSANFSRSRPKILCVEIRTGVEEDYESTKALRLMLEAQGFVAYHPAHGNGIFLSKEARTSLRFFE